MPTMKAWCRENGSAAVSWRDGVSPVARHRTVKSLVNHSFVCATLRGGWTLSVALVAPYSSPSVSAGCASRKSSTFSVATSSLKRSTDSSTPSSR